MKQHEKRLFSVVKTAAFYFIKQSDGSCFMEIDQKLSFVKAQGLRTGLLAF